jgi:hypothetical protein
MLNDLNINLINITKKSVVFVAHFVKPEELLTVAEVRKEAVVLQVVASLA